jgi:ATP-binding cassette subfamily B protein
MFKFISQHDQMDCGPACLAMVAQAYGKKYPLYHLREIAFASREGVSVLGIVDAARSIGFDDMVARPTLQQLQEEVPLPCILHWNQNHFVVLYKISKGIFRGKPVYKIADPGHGFVTLSEDRFSQHWLSDDGKGVAILLQPGDEFHALQPPEEQHINIRYLLDYLRPHRKSLWVMLLLLFLGSLASLVFPFLAQNLIDKGVTAKDMQFITIILLSQLALFLGTLVIELFRNWLVLVVGTRINIQILSDFLKKLLKLPIRFFDTKNMGDFNQRIQDHERIESFLTSQTLLTFFSMITFTVFFGVLWYYNINILLIYLTLTVVSIIWSVVWLGRRKILDYIRFQQRSENQESIYEMINGVSEMKLNQFEEYKRNEWQQIQQKLFKINIRILKLTQVQGSGFEFLNQVKNIVVTFFAATLVVKDQMTIGALLSISYIIGQMNAPVTQLVNFFRSLQDAKLSLARLNDVQSHPEEEQETLPPPGKLSPAAWDKGSIQLDNVSFQYDGPKSQFVLNNVHLKIPAGKITAIVGASGSGKTTLMKLLLKFYAPTSGEIYIGRRNLKTISPSGLRQHCGVVMQDGFIFGDSIGRNIVCGDEQPDMERLNNALKVANIEEFIQSLPLGLNTKVGASGSGLSGGQKQRILIARAVYKNPHYIFFDEATSALDAENEQIIHNNLTTFFKDKTVVIIAHRLSTVKNADQIIVMKNGGITEQGSHYELVSSKTEYYNLVKNQLELGV